jgi:hypothetical protein
MMGVNIGDPYVVTTHNRGHNAEEMADLALNKIIHVGSNSHPLIIEQAKAFKEQIRYILIEYFRKAQEEERSTLKVKLVQHGFDDLAKIIEKL